MQGVTYLVAAYAIAWVGLFAYLAFLMMRVRGVHIELAAVTELVHEQQERKITRDNELSSWKADKQVETYDHKSEER